MPTSAAIRNAALRKLRVIGEGETPSTDLQTDTDAAYTQLHAFLETKRATVWDSDEDIPDEAAHATTIMLAYYVGDEHVDEARYQRLKVEAMGNPLDPADRGALGELIDLAQSDYVPTRVRTEYY